MSLEIGPQSFDAEPATIAHLVVIYSVNGDELLVLIIATGNRKNVYRSLDRLK